MAQAAVSHDALIAWEPQRGPQTALVTCPVFEVFYGGARGGGKTDGMLGEWLSHADLYGEDAIGLMLRRSRVQLIETIERAKQIYYPLFGVKVWHEQDKMFRFPNGARLRFAYLERDQDAQEYQGHSYTRVYVEELTNFPDPGPIMKLMAVLRSPKGVPVGFRATGNPGGPGHQWVKSRYIDPAPGGWEVQVEEFENPFTGDKTSRERIYIPSRLTDNAYLGTDYVAQLQMSGSENLVRAWLLGDWDVIEGAFFDCWDSSRHVIKPFKVPEHWFRFRSMDWGFARPFSVGWWAVASEAVEVHGRLIPKGAMVRYREWYGAKEPNVGLRMTAEDVARGIMERTGKDEKVSYTVCDPAMFAEDGGPSIAERMERASKSKLKTRRGDNKRIAAAGAQGGWDQMRGRLVGEDMGDGNVPMLFCFETCTDSIRTVPALQHDATRHEDLDTDGEDHAADEWRYACMSRPWTRPKPADPEKMKGIEALTLDRLWKEHERGYQR